MNSIAKRIKLIVCSFVVAFSAIFLLPLGNVSASSPHFISGKLSDMNGFGLSGWFVGAYNENGVDHSWRDIDENGNYSVPVYSGTYDFKFYNGDDEVWVNDQVITDDATINASTNFATTAFSGTLLDSLGNPLWGQKIRLSTAQTDSEPEVTVQANGSFAVRGKSASNYALRIIQSGTNNGSGLFGFEFGTAYGAIDLTNGDVQKNLVVSRKNVTINVKDYQNNPVANEYIESQAGNWPGESSTELSPGISGYFGVSTGATTDTNGTAVLKLVEGSFYGQRYENDSPYYMDNICASSLMDNTSKRLCIYDQDVRVTSDMTINMQPRPLAPTGLTTQAPVAQVPEFSWNASAGATSYKIYRNNTLVDTVSSNSFNDTVSPEGQHAYKVTALRNGVESLPSNTIYPAVDRSAPTLSYMFSNTIMVNGWYKGNVNVWFTCNDTISNVVSCTGSQLLQNDTAGQTVTGTAVDTAGNTASLSTVVKIDRVAPVISSVVLNPTTTLRTGNTLTVTANGTDATSGISSGEFFIGADPGIGAGTPLTINQAATQGVGSKVISGLANGNHTVSVRFKDQAGNWTGNSTAVFAFRK